MKWQLTAFAFFICSLTFSQTKDELYAKLKTAKNDTNTVRLYGKISRYYVGTEPDSSTHYIGLGLRLARKLNDRLGEAMMMSVLGSLNETHGNLSLAKKYYEDALQISIELDDKNAIAQTKNGLGVIEGKTGHYAKATTYFLEALEIFKSIGNTNGIIQCYIKLGTVNDFNNNPKLALSYYNKAMELNKNDTLNNAYFTLLNNIGIIYAKSGDLQKALSYFEKGLNGSNTPKLIDVHISLLNSAMKASALLGYRSKALYYHNTAITKSRQYQLPDEEARALINYADEMLGDNPTLATEYYQQALALTQKISNREFTAEINLGLSDLYKQQNNYKAALEALETYQKIHDSLFNINKSRELATLFGSYELNESKNKIKELELNNKKRTAERNLVIGFVAATLLILFILIYYINRTKKLNAQLQENNLVKDKIFSIIGHDLKTPVSGLVQTLDLLDSGIIDEAQRKFIINTLSKQTKITYDTLELLLNWGQAQLKGVSVDMQNFQPKTIINRNVDMIMGQANEKSISIVDNVSQDIAIYADANQFEFIMRNLLSNAVKFTNENGKIEIDAKENDKRDAIIFSVKDNGKGINPEQLQKFISSNIAVAYGTKGEKGTGLGLLLTKEFMKANHGKIWATSKEGEGSTFYIQLKKAKV